MSGHTPGPYSLHRMAGGVMRVEDAPEYTGWDFRHITIGAGDKILGRVEYQTYAAGYPKIDDMAEAEAVADLWIAAPDMLAALEGLEHILARAESNASGNPEWEAVSGRINAARAAIAKATGAA